MQHPASINLDFFQSVESHLDSERLQVYRQDGQDDATTLARYLLNMALCESLYSPLQVAEVSLRNSIHQSLAAKVKHHAWYDSLLLPKWQQEQVLKAKQKLRDQRKPETSGRIVAELTFGFWLCFFTAPHISSGLAYYLIKSCFPHAPKSERNIHKLSASWQKVRILRNRVFHHERILHWRDLDKQHTSILHLIGWMNPELKQLTQALNRFAKIQSEGLTPWRHLLCNNWPNNASS